MKTSPRRMMSPVVLIGIAVLLTILRSVGTQAEDVEARYFEQLRVRGLHSLAEGHALRRLSETNLAPARRVELAVELSRTLADHAGFAADDQRNDYWQRSRSVLTEEKQRHSSEPELLRLDIQAAMSHATEAAWRRDESEVRTYDEAFQTETLKACDAALGLIQSLERRLSESPKSDVTKPLAGSTANEVRTALARIRLHWGLTLKNRAMLAAASSRERMADSVEAEQFFRKLTAHPDLVLAGRAKLGLVACARIKGELDRADEMLSLLDRSDRNDRDDKGEPFPMSLAGELAAERCRLLLDKNRAADAVEFTVRYRRQHERLTGELSYLQTRGVIALREFARSKQDAALEQKFTEQIELGLDRIDELVGGYWGRRSRALWDLARTSEKFGPGLDAAMQQARADFLAGRIDSALKGYASSELAARTSGQTDLAMDIGYTRASILLRETRHDEAATEFLRLATEYPNHSRAAAAHLNGAFCLGRLVDAEPTPARRDAYAKALDRHLSRFSRDPTTHDVRFLKGRFEEQSHNHEAALSFYAAVAPDHARAGEAQAGLARCYEAVIGQKREQKQDVTVLLRTAEETLSPLLPVADPTSPTWNVFQAEVALHLAAILIQAVPPRWERTDGLLNVVIACADQATESEQLDRWKRLRQRAVLLRVIALVGSGRTRDAARSMDALTAASSSELIDLVDRLLPMTASTTDHRRPAAIELLLRTSELLLKQRPSATKEKQRELDHGLGRIYLTTGQITKGVELYKGLADQSPKDANAQRLVGGLLQATTHRDCHVVAKQCWRRAETLAKQGTAEWLSARLGVLECCILLGEKDEARKLLGVTRLLYPSLGDAAQQERFKAIERSLGATGSTTTPVSKSTPVKR